MNEIEKAIDHFTHGIMHDIFREPVATYARLAVTALREKQERSGCNWCTVFSANRQHLFSAGNGMYDEATYAYCPMCGRRLEGKQDG